MFFLRLVFYYLFFILFILWVEIVLTGLSSVGDGELHDKQNKQSSVIIIDSQGVYGWVVAVSNRHEG